MGFSLMYRKTPPLVSGPRQVAIRRDAEGDVFLHGAGHGRVLRRGGCARLSDRYGEPDRPALHLPGRPLHLPRRHGLDRLRAGGIFGEDEKSSLFTLAGVEVFFTERGFAVFYDDLVRAGAQMPAVRCSEVDSVRRVPAVM